MADPETIRRIREALGMLRGVSGPVLGAGDVTREGQGQAPESFPPLFEDLVPFDPSHTDAFGGGFGSTPVIGDVDAGANVFDPFSLPGPAFEAIKDAPFPFSRRQISSPSGTEVAELGVTGDVGAAPTLGGGLAEFPQAAGEILKLPFEALGAGYGAIERLVTEEDPYGEPEGSRFLPEVSDQPFFQSRLSQQAPNALTGVLEALGPLTQFNDELAGLLVTRFQDALTDLGLASEGDAARRARALREEGVNTMVAARRGFQETTDIPGIIRFLIQAGVDPLNLIPGLGFSRTSYRTAAEFIELAGRKTVEKALPRLKSAVDDVFKRARELRGDAARRAERGVSAPAKSRADDWEFWHGEEWKGSTWEIDAPVTDEMRAAADDWETWPTDAPVDDVFIAKNEMAKTIVKLLKEAGEEGRSYKEVIGKSRQTPAKSRADEVAELGLAVPEQRALATRDEVAELGLAGDVYPASQRGGGIGATPRSWQSAGPEDLDNLPDSFFMRSVGTPFEYDIRDVYSKSYLRGALRHNVEQPVVTKHPINMSEDEFFDALDEFKAFEKKLDAQERAITGAGRGRDPKGSGRELTDEEEGYLGGLRGPEETSMPQNFEELNEFRQVFRITEDFSNAELFGVLGRNMYKIKPETLQAIQSGRHVLLNEQVSAGIVSRAVGILERRGISQSDIFANAAQVLAGDVEPADAAFLLEDWLRVFREGSAPAPTPPAPPSAQSAILGQIPENQSVQRAQALLDSIKATDSQTLEEAMDIAVRDIIEVTGDAKQGFVPRLAPKGPFAGLSPNERIFGSTIHRVSIKTEEKAFNAAKEIIFKNVLRKGREDQFLRPDLADDVFSMEHQVRESLIRTGKFDISAAPAPPPKPRALPAQQIDELDIPPAPTPKNQPVRGGTFKHFTTPESRASLESGQPFDVTRTPQHGTGDLGRGVGTGKFAGNRLYLSLDDARWSELTKPSEGKVIESTLENMNEGGTPFFDYQTQKWMQPVEADTVIPLEPVEFQVAPNARVLTIDSEQAYFDAVDQFGRLRENGPGWDNIANAGIDVVEIRNVDRLATAGGRSMKFFREAASDQLVVLNPDVAQVGGAAAQVTPPVTAADDAIRGFTGRDVPEAAPAIPEPRALVMREADESVPATRLREARRAGEAPEVTPTIPQERALALRQTDELDIPAPQQALPEGGGIPPGGSDIPAGPVFEEPLFTPSTKIRDSLLRNAEKEGKIDFSDVTRIVLEQLNDSYWGLRKLQDIASKSLDIAPGGADDLVTMITRHPGAVPAALARYERTVNEIRRIALGIDPVHIDTMLIAANGRSILRNKEGGSRVLTQGINTEQGLVEELQSIMNDIGPTDFNRARDAAEVVRNIYKEERKRLVHAGIMSREMSDKFDEMYPWYNPTQYMDALRDNLPRAQTSKGFTVTDNNVRRLAERGSTGDVQSPLQVLANQLSQNEVRIAKNEIAKTIVKLLKEAGEEANEVIGKSRRPTAQKGLPLPEGKQVDDFLFSDTPGTLSYFENGTRRVFKVPDWAFREATMLSSSTSDPITGLVGGLNGISRAAFTTFSPVFVVGNFFNDMLSAAITRGVMPWDSALRLRNIIRGLDDDPLWQSFRLSGGFQSRFYGRNTAKVAKQMGIKDGQVITNNKQWNRILLDSIPRAGEATEQAPRLALYKRMLDENLPNWRDMTPEQIVQTEASREAAAAAVEVTINFGRGGALIKSINPFILFLNASMEGVKLPFRALRFNKNARIRLAGVAAGSAALSAYNFSYPEYFDIPWYIRVGSGVVMLPSNEKDEFGRTVPNYATIIPRTREWGLFLAPITFAMEKMFTDNQPSFTDFSRVLAPQVVPVTAVTGGLGPEIASEFAEQIANYDYYRSRPIVPSELQSLPAEEQVTNWTSRTMQEIGETVGLSPVRLEHAVRGTLGGAADVILSGTDYALNALLPAEVNPHAAELVKQVESIEDPTERRAFMNSLTNDERTMVNELLRQPDPRLPLVTPLQARFFGERGGQIRIDAQKAAADEAGLSQSDTRQAGKDLSRVSQVMLTEQVEDNTLLRDNKITTGEWRDRRRELSVRYRGALDLVGVNFPKAAQVADDEVSAEYYRRVAVMSNASGDLQGKRQTLLSGWYAISPEKDAETDREDWSLFFDQRDAFKESLSAEDRNILDAELASRNTPMENEYQRDLDSLRGYFEIERSVIEETSKKPGFEDLLSEYAAYRRGGNPEFRARHPKLNAALTLANARQKAERLKNSEVARLLWKWDFRDGAASSAAGVPLPDNPTIRIEVLELLKQQRESGGVTDRRAIDRQSTQLIEYYDSPPLYR